MTRALMIAELDDRGWQRYPLRVCRSLRHCEICSRDITRGEAYYDGGYTRRAHQKCIPQPTSRPEAQTP
jgi:hypothetical protein